MTRLKEIALLLFAIINNAKPISSMEENERQLSNHLLTNYDKSIRPARSTLEPVNVTFGLALTQIIDVDERNQILTTNCWLRQVWKDYGLTWNSSDFAGITAIRIPAANVWKPDIILYNNADTDYVRSTLSTNAIVSSDGNVTWISNVIFRSSCTINVAWFPFDEQNCSMKFASWSYDGFLVNVFMRSKEGDLSNYVNNGEWDLMALTSERNVIYYSCCDEPYPDVTFYIVVRRRPLFYVFNMILPCMLITGISLLSFYIPSDSGEKVTLGVTALLSMTVFLMVIGESLPPTSDTVPLISLYYALVMTLVSLATAMSIATLNMHHGGRYGNKIPRYVKKVVFGILAKVVFINPNLVMEDRTSSMVFKNVRNIRKTAKKAFDSRKVDEGTKLHVCDFVTNFPTSTKSATENIEAKVLNTLDKVCNAIERHERRAVEQGTMERIKQEWQLLALVIDRFLLIIFIILTLGTTLGIFFVSPYARLY